MSDKGDWELALSPDSGENFLSDAPPGARVPPISQKDSGGCSDGRVISSRSCAKEDAVRFSGTEASIGQVVRRAGPTVYEVETHSTRWRISPSIIV